MWPAKDIVTAGLSATAFLLSATTAWVTLRRRGKLYLPRPAQIYFGSERTAALGRALSPKVYLRCTLFSSGKRGHIVESLYVRLRRGETAQVFNIWVFGEKELSRGGGLYVGEQGVVSNHHALLPEDGTSLPWLEGEYVLEVFAALVPGSRTVRLLETRLALGAAEVVALKEGTAGVFFDWSPEARTYQRHVRPPVPRALAA